MRSRERNHVVPVSNKPLPKRYYVVASKKNGSNNQIPHSRLRAPCIATPASRKTNLSSLRSLSSTPHRARPGRSSRRPRRPPPKAGLFLLVAGALRGPHPLSRVALSWTRVFADRSDSPQPASRKRRASDNNTGTHSPSPAYPGVWSLEFVDAPPASLRRSFPARPADNQTFGTACDAPCGCDRDTCRAACTFGAGQCRPRMEEGQIWMVRRKSPRLRIVQLSEEQSPLLLTRRAARQALRHWGRIRFSVFRKNRPTQQRPLPILRRLGIRRPRMLPETSFSSAAVILCLVRMLLSLEQCRFRQ